VLAQPNLVLQRTGCRRANGVCSRDRES